MTAVWTMGLGIPRARTVRHPSRYRQARARSSNANQPLATHADKGSSKSSTTSHWVERQGSLSEHVFRSPSTSLNSDRLTFQVKPNALSNNLSTWGSREPQSWSVMEADEGHHTLTHKWKENTFLTATKTRDDSVFAPLKLPIDQILHVIKHQS